MMTYKLTMKSNSYVSVSKLHKRFELIPNCFKNKIESDNKGNVHKQEITISFRWLLWRYDIVLIRHLKTKQNGK